MEFPKENFISHYTSDINAIRILASQTFKFGHLQNTNDPFERLENRVLVPGPLNPDLRNYLNGLFAFCNSEMSIGCFGGSEGTEPLDEKWTMWAHYGNRHKGVCLIFDKNKLIEEVEKKTKDYEKDMINYRLEKLILTINNQILNIPFDKFIKDFKSSILFTKHKDWSCENEFRLVVFEGTFEIPIKDCLKVVAFGPEMDMDLEEACYVLIEKHFNANVKSGKLRYSGSGYLRPFSFFPQ